MSKPRILVLPGSTRAGSVNVKLAGVIVKTLAELGADVTWLSLSDYEMPIYGGDLEKERAFPKTRSSWAVTLSKATLPCWCLRNITVPYRPFSRMLWTG